MSDEVAFALKDAYAEDGDQPFAGATMAWGPNGETANLGAMLDEGGGFILTSDAALVAALDEHDYFKRTARADAEAAGAPVLVKDPGGGPPAPHEPPDEEEAEAPAPEPTAPEPVNFDAHSLEDLRGMYAAELSVAEADVPDDLTRRQLADAINTSRESRGAVGGGE